METGLIQNGGRLTALAKSAGYDAERLATLCGSSPRQFRRTFQERFGCPPREWLNNLMMAEAIERLLAGQQAKQVAYEVGFNHPSSFYRWFKQSTGFRSAECIKSILLRNGISPMR